MKIAWCETVNPNSGLVESFRRLDELLLAIVGLPDTAPEVNANPYRALFIAADDLRRSLQSEPGSIPPRFLACDSKVPRLLEPLGPSTRFKRLQDAFSLKDFELAGVLVALAAEYDLKYGCAFAYLRDDISRRRPNVNLVLDMLCASDDEKAAYREFFAPGSNLIRHRILRLGTDPSAQESILACSVHLEEQVARFLLGEDGLDPRLTAACRLVYPLPPDNGPTAEVSYAEASKRDLPRIIAAAKKSRARLRLYFRGAPHGGQLAEAKRIAAVSQSPLLVVDPLRFAGPTGPDDDLVALLKRDARLHGALLFIDFRDAPTDRALIRRLDDLPLPVIISGTQPWDPDPRSPLPVVSISFELPDATARRALWKSSLKDTAITEPVVDKLAGLYRLHAEQISAACASAAAANLVTPSVDRTEAYFQAARAQAGSALARLARKVEPVHDWDDLILEPSATEQLEDLCRRAEQKSRVLDEWGFRRKIARSGGTVALFSGPSGTGKTTAGSVIADRLRLDLYEIELSRIISKYIGETEKNLREIFDAAVNSNSILLINEAEAVCGKRSEVRDAHDRYANIEVAFLLQEMERLDGIVILTTNLRNNLDDAFTRRFDFIVDMAFPDVGLRRRIWEVHLRTKGASPAIDLDLLANMRLSGGNIRNVVYAGAYLAAADGSLIETEHLIRAARYEYRKLGRLPEELETGANAKRRK